MGKVSDTSQSQEKDEFTSEFFSARGWALEGIGTIAFGTLATVFLTGTLDIKEEWEWYAVGLGFLAPALVAILARGKIPRRAVFWLALATLAVTESAFYFLVVNP